MRNFLLRVQPSREIIAEIPQLIYSNHNKSVLFNFFLLAGQWEENLLNNAVSRWVLLGNVAVA